MRRPSASAPAESLLRDRAERSARKPSHITATKIDKVTLARGVGGVRSRPAKPPWLHSQRAGGASKVRRNLGRVKACGASKCRRVHRPNAPLYAQRPRGRELQKLRKRMLTLKMPNRPAKVGETPWRYIAIMSCHALPISRCPPAGSSNTGGEWCRRPAVECWRLGSGRA